MFTESPVCRIGDHITGTCEASGSDHPRDFIGVWTTGSDYVTADGIPVVRVGDFGVTDCGHTIQAATGSDYVTADNIPVVRVNDLTIIIEGGHGVAVTGSDIVVAG